MEFESWQAFYRSGLQGFYALIVVPALFLGYLLASKRVRVAAGHSPEARFLRVYALVFCIETLADPFCTGPLVLWLELGSRASSAIMIAFVLLGDFRVFFLVFFLTRADRRVGPVVGKSALWTLLVPLFAVSVSAGLSQLQPDPSGQRLWLIYEGSFLALALFLRGRVVSRPLRRILVYVAVYYGLWATSDLLIHYGGLDVGWLLRALPNQLYYSFWIPMVYATLVAKDDPRN